VSKIFKIIFIFLLAGCSLNDPTGIWSKKKDKKNDLPNSNILFENKKTIIEEFNIDLEFQLENIKIDDDKLSYLTNNNGFKNFNSKLDLVSRFKFSKIENFKKIEPNIIFSNNDLIFFDNKGSILKFDKNTNLIWKTNIYSKSEKKLHPLINLDKKDNLIVAADSLGKYYALDSLNGNLLWQKDNISPFNSQIKIYKNCILLVDSSNSLKCYSLVNGEEIWSHNTEKTFINSIKKLSFVIKDDQVIFINSLGDLTSVSIDSGELNWQTTTYNTELFQEIMTLKNSIIIMNENSIFFSNNKNEFYSIDIKTGLINWRQKISSDLRPSIVGNLILTITPKGYLFLIDKKSGNILKITNLLKKINIKKRKNLILTGFVLNKENIFVSTNKGLLLVVDLKTSVTKNILKFYGDKISRPFIYNKHIYLLRDNSILKLN